MILIFPLIIPLIIVIISIISIARNKKMDAYDLSLYQRFLKNLSHAGYSFYNLNKYHCKITADDACIEAKVFPSSANLKYLFDGGNWRGAYYYRSQVALCIAGSTSQHEDNELEKIIQILKAS